MTEASMNIQMVDSDEVLLENMVMNFINRLPADENLTVVSIIGRQNTGKSHLLNCLFGTDFNVLDPQQNHGQTTRGIWIAQCPANPSIVVIDIEGSDSSTNAQNGTSFANRAALFALTISDVLFLNMEARGLGQYEGGSLPLLQTIFGERISLSRRKTRVEVTLRDCRNLKNDIDKVRVEEIIKECWNSGPASKGSLEDYIEVSVVTFPNATDSGQAIQNEFQSKVAQLREKLTGLTPTQSRDTFLYNVRTIWPAIRSNKNLNIPSFNETLSTHRCNTIMQQELSSLDSNEEFSQLRDMKDTTSSVSFQRSLAEFLTSTFERFDESADGTIPGIRKGFKTTLQQKITKKLEVKFLSILRTETNKKVEEKKEQISSHLRAMKKGFVSSIFTPTFNLEAFESNIDVDSIVKVHVREFDEIFEGCLEEYTIFVSIYKEKVVHTLKDYAEREIMGIKKIYKFKVFIGKGVLISIGVGSSVYLLNCGAKIILASFLPALAAWSQAARSKIPTILEYMLQNIITPAAKICVQHMMEHRKVIVAHLGKQMFNLSMAMVALLLEIISNQPHSYGFRD